MSNRPSDWTPLTGGDPCPGDPDAWIPVISHWESRAQDVQNLANELSKITATNGVSHRVQRMEKVASEGQTALSHFSDAFTAARETANSWKGKLADMQERADAALRSAQDAHANRADSSAQISTLGAIASAAKKKDASVDAKKRHLVEEMAAAQLVIDAAQRTVDGIREEYARESSAVVEAYSLQRAGTWSLSTLFGAGGSFAPSVSAVSDELGGLGDKGKKVSAAYEKVLSDPEKVPELLSELSDLSPEQLSVFFASHPDLALVPLFPEGTSVENTFMVKDWWGNPSGDGKSGFAGEKLSDEQKKALIAAAPGFVGNLDGVSYGERDQALRDLLDDLLSGNKWVVAGESMDADTRVALENVKSSLSDNKTDVRQLIQLDLVRTLPKYRDSNPDNNVMASISIGDLDASQNTTSVIHGMDNSAYGSMPAQMEQGQNIYDARKAYLQGVPQAVIVRAGYDAPPSAGDQFKYESAKFTAEQLSGQQIGEYQPYNGGDIGNSGSPSVRRPDAAERGGVALAGFSDGFLATKASDADHLNEADYSIVAHSYGTTVATDSLTRMEGKVDSYVAVGSAGVKQSDIDRANTVGLAVDTDDAYGNDGKQNIYYAATDKDWTAPGGYVGTGTLDPALKRDTPDKIEDATALQTGSGFSLDGKYWEDVDQHGLLENNDPNLIEQASDISLTPLPQQGYYTPGTTSLESIAQASMGLGDRLQVLLEANDQWEWGPVSGERVLSGDISEDKARELLEEQGLSEDDVVGSKPGNFSERKG